MASDFGQWERVASELRACRDAQQQAWGDIDNAILGRYLAGDVTPEERRRVEAALQSHPELKQLTDLVSDVLRDCEPVPADEPAVLPLRRTAPAVRKRPVRWVRWAAFAAAACLLLGIGYAVLQHDFGRFAPRGAAVTGVPDGGLTRVEPGKEPPGGVHKVAATHPPLPAAPAGGGWDWSFFTRKSGLKDDSSKTDRDPAVLVADGLSAAGSTYEKYGDLDLAEFSYRLAYKVQEWRLGDDAAPTVETRRNLGAVYQTALAMDTDRRDAFGAFAFEKSVTNPAAVPAPAPPAPADDKAKEAEALRSAALLRQRITKQPVRELRQSVVPVLVQNLREARTPEARVQCSLALAELGPAARDAVPVLEECLRKAETPRESAAMLSALGEAGPAAAPQAAPVLVTSLKSPSPEVRRAAEDALSNYGRAARDEMQKLTEGAGADRPEWRDLKERLKGVEGRIGVRDGCDLLSVHALRQSQREIRELARTRRVEVYAETRPTLPKDEEEKADREHEQEVADAGVTLVIHPSPLTVRAYVGRGLQAEGLDAGKLRQAVEDASRQDFDDGLLAGVRFVERFAAEKVKTPQGTDKPK